MCCLGGVNSLQRVHASKKTLCREFTPPKTTQYTVNSKFPLNCKMQPKCNDDKKFSLKMTQQG
jgi:hypothetical protein